MTVHVDRDESEAVLTVSGDLDADSAYGVYLAAVEAAGDGSTSVVVDLAGVEFIDSTGLGMLIRSRDELAHNSNSRLRLRRPSEHVRRLLDLTALTGEFEFADAPQ